MSCHPEASVSTSVYVGQDRLLRLGGGSGCCGYIVLPRSFLWLRRGKQDEP